MSADLQLIDTFLATAGVGEPPPEWQAQALQLYERVQAGRSRASLMAVPDLHTFAVKHIADSLLLLAFQPDLRNTELAIADVGCGAGFPGLALAPWCPQAVFTEIDSTAKKVRFVADAIAALELANCRTATGRARELGRGDHAGAFDVVLCRAVGPLGKLVRETRSLLRPDGGRLIAYKTPGGVADEQAEGQREAAKAGLTLALSPVYELPADAGARQFVLLCRQ
jgi:16S rRNA (guanine527-N7)-methyltransferase